MLIAFGARNFYCFKEQVNISLAFNSKVPPQITKGKKCATAICLKGANASGKTNAVKILNFLARFCTNSFNDKPEAQIEVEGFFDSKKPIELYADFESMGVTYSYETRLTRESIIEEKLYKKERRKTLVLHREGNVVKKNTISAKKDFSLRSNASIISTLNQYEDKSIIDVYTFFRSIFTNVSSQGYRGPTLIGHNESAKFYHENPEYLEFTKELIKRFDTGVSDITIKSFKSDEGIEVFFPLYVHETSEGEQVLIHSAQSSGTKSLFNHLLLYGLILKSGGVLALDEFDINLHPDILPHLIRLFENPESNPDSAQIIISTHNNEIMDVLGKYRTFLFNKRNNESFCYRLDEIDSDLIRNDRPILPLYNAGKLGGTPRI